MRYISNGLMIIALAPAASAQFGPLTPVYPADTNVLAELVDVDGDGILDLVTLEVVAPGSQVDVRWSKGGASVAFGPSEMIATLPGQISNLSSEARSIDAGDLNGDGFVDFVVPTVSGLFRVDGGPGGQFSPPRIIDPGPCSDVQVIDLDQDGDLDIAKGGFYDVSLPVDILFLNDAAGSFSPQSLPGTCCQYGAPMFTDVDLDGDLDVVLVNGFPAAVKYFENLGGSNYANSIIISQLPFGPVVALADIDQDGDDDILYAHFSNRPTGWIENVAGSFDINHVIAAVSASLSAPRAGDMDGDGDMDFILVQDNRGTSWYANDGGNHFPQQLAIDSARRGANVVGLIDGNGDLALDILLTATDPMGVFIYENFGGLGTDTCTANANSTGVPAALRASGSRSASANRFALTLHGAPAAQFAAFLAGRVAQASTLPGSAGVLCLGAPFGIFRAPGQIAQIGPGGSLLMPIDLTAIPAGAGLQAVQSGETWLFQSIFRDPTPLGVSNLSPAIQVTFVP